MTKARKPFPLLKEDWQPCKYCGNILYKGDRVVTISENRWQTSYSHPKCHLKDLKNRKKELINVGIPKHIFERSFNNEIKYVEDKIALLKEIK